MRVSLETAPRRLPAPALILVIGAVWFALAGAALVIDVVWHAGLELCLFRRLTGIPCPFCGTGRGFLRLLEGRPLAALAANPFSMTAHALAVLYLLFRVAFRKRLVWELSRGERLFAGLAAGGLLVVNWAYLIFRSFSV